MIFNAYNDIVPEYRKESITSVDDVKRYTDMMKIHGTDCIIDDWYLERIEWTNIDGLISGTAIFRKVFRIPTT